MDCEASSDQWAPEDLVAAHADAARRRGWCAAARDGAAATLESRVLVRLRRPERLDPPAVADGAALAMALASVPDERGVRCLALTLLVDGARWDAAPRAAPLSFGVKLDGDRWVAFAAPAVSAADAGQRRRASPADADAPPLILWSPSLRGRRRVQLMALDHDGFPLAATLSGALDVDPRPAPGARQRSDAWYVQFPHQRRARERHRLAAAPRDAAQPRRPRARAPRATRRRRRRRRRRRGGFSPAAPAAPRRRAPLVRRSRDAHAGPDEPAVHVRAHARRRQRDGPRAAAAAARLRVGRHALALRRRALRALRRRVRRRARRARERRRARARRRDELARFFGRPRGRARGASRRSRPTARSRPTRPRSTTGARTRRGRLDVVAVTGDSEHAAWMNLYDERARAPGRLLSLSLSGMNRARARAPRRVATRRDSHRPPTAPPPPPAAAAAASRLRSPTRSPRRRARSRALAPDLARVAHDTTRARSARPRAAAGSSRCTRASSPTGTGTAR